MYKRQELNLLCCMFAKKAGHCHAIARVRNPSYSHELDFIKKQLELDTKNILEIMGRGD